MMHNIGFEETNVKNYIWNNWEHLSIYGLLDDSKKLLFVA